MTVPQAIDHESAFDGYWLNQVGKLRRDSRLSKKKLGSTPIRLSLAVLRRQSQCRLQKKYRNTHCAIDSSVSVDMISINHSITEKRESLRSSKKAGNLSMTFKHSTPLKIDIHLSPG